MIFLNASTDSLELITSAAGSVDYVVNWVDRTTTTHNPSSSQGNITTATDTTITAAPAASTQRKIESIFIRNRSTTASNVVTVMKDVSTNEYHMTPAITLSAGECLCYDGSGWYQLDAAGKRKVDDVQRSGYTGRNIGFYKAGTVADTIAYWYCTAKDGGFPGAWAPGTPGVAGRATDGTVAADFGSIPFTNPASGSMYLTSANLTSTINHWHMIFDCLWVNSGITVTTTTAQNINSVAFPARDVNGTVNGEGCIIGILTTTANTNAAVISNSTISYTNSAGTAGRTATLLALAGAQIPATPVIGTIVWFMLAAGDKGVQSIQTITLGTSLGAGAISVIVARPIISIPTTVVNVGNQAIIDPYMGIRLYNGSCLLHCYQASAVTATVISGTFQMTER